mgnify:CR=1 FL=1
MEQFVNQIIDKLYHAPDVYLYGFLFVSAIVENLFPPIPGDTITAFGAFLVGKGRLSYFYVYLWTTLGSVIGFMSLFFLGRFLEKDFFMKKNYKFFSAESIVEAERWFNKYGYFVILGNRFLPGVRSVISIFSGISLLSPLRVLLFSLISASVWNLIWIHVGYTLGDNWDLVKEKFTDILTRYNMVAGIIIGLFIVLYAVHVIRKRRKEREKASGEGGG